MKKKSFTAIVLAMVITLFTATPVEAAKKKIKYTDEERQLAEVIWEYEQEHVEEDHMDEFYILYINKVNIKPDDSDFETIKFIARVIYTFDEYVDNFGTMLATKDDYIYISGDYTLISEDDMDHYTVKKSHKKKNKNWKKTVHSYHLINVIDLVNKAYSDSIKETPES